MSLSAERWSLKFPQYRARRARIKANIHRMLQETRLSVDDLIYPLFAIDGRNIREEIPSMPGVYHLSVDRLKEEIEEVLNLRIPAVLLFGVPDPAKKDELGPEAYNGEGIAQRAVRKIREISEDLVIITDVCLCGYTSHGHCGLVRDGKILNDETLELLSRIALSHAEAGADIVAPSGMIDGMVRAIRNALDEYGFTNVGIMSYAVKYSSSFYGPFRAVKVRGDLGSSDP